MTDIEDRLHQDAAQWRTHRQAEPSFRTALSRAVMDTSEKRQQRYPAQMAAAAAAVIAVVATALTIGHLHRARHTSSTTAPPASRTSATNCPALPRATRRYASSVGLTIAAPAQATTGDSVSVHASLTATGLPITLPDAAQPAAVFLLQDGIVKAHSGPQRGTGYIFRLAGSPRTLPTAPLQLTICTAQHGVNVLPAGGEATPLPSGAYQLVVVFKPDERSDDGIISDPATIQVTGRA